MSEIDPKEFAELLNNLLHASYRLTGAHIRNRGTKTPTAEKRRSVDRLFLRVFGRKATEDEHDVIGTQSVSYGGW